MTGALYDKILLALAQLAPVSLIFLSGWYASLDTWYVPVDASPSTYSESDFAQKADQWLQVTANNGITYYVFVDPQCACTNPSLKKLQSAITQSDHPNANIVTIDVTSDITPDHRNQNSNALNALIDEIPSVPMVITADDTTLIYSGPANAGNFCTTQVDQALPVIATASAQTAPVHNWLSRGCYCQSQPRRT